MTRNGHKYTDTRPGLGNYRIPKAMVTTLDGKRIPYDEYAPEKGIVRDESCFYDPSLPGWYCQTSDSLRHFMMNFQMLDADYMVRRLSLGLKANLEIEENKRKFSLNLIEIKGRIFIFDNLL